MLAMILPSQAAHPILEILEMSAFVSLKLGEIPDYLHASSFYQALSSGDDGTDSEIEVPLRCYKPDCFVDDTTDLEQMFRVIQFWGLDRIPTPVLHFLYNNDYSLWKDTATNLLGESALLSTLQKVLDKPATSSHIVNAINSGLTEFVEYCIEFAGTPEKTSGAAVLAACERGRADFLKLLHQKGFSWSEVSAEKGNNIECLAYALENECPLMVPQAMDAALSSGYLECIRLITENGGLLDARAAAKGHADCLRYAIEHGCPCSSTVVKLAAQAGSLACLTYLIEEKGRYMCEDGSVMEAALTGAHYECLKFLFEKKCPMGRCYFGDEVCWTYYDRYRTQVDWDENLLKCILLATSHGWNYTYKNNLKDYILDYKNELPKCLEHITINK
eukprot:gene22816-25847_t